MTPKAIRQDIVSRVLAADTTAGTNVFGSRVNPLKLNTIPAVIIYTTGRSGSNVNHTDPTFTVDVDVEIFAVVAKSSGWDDQLDDLLEEIKTALFGDSAFYTQFEDISEYSEDIIIHDDAEAKMATGNLKFSVQTWQQY